MEPVKKVVKKSKTKTKVKSNSTTNTTSSTVKKCYCRKCMKTKTENSFYVSTNKIIDSNGFMSICKECCNSLYDVMYAESNHNTKVAIYKVCELLDIVYFSDAATAAISQLKTVLTSGDAMGDKVIGYYKGKITAFAGNRKHTGGLTFAYSDPNPFTYENENGETSEEMDDAEMGMKWGTNFTIEEYAFLERELSNWKASHVCNNHSELTLLQEICITKLNIRRARQNNVDTDKLVKELQALMKTAAIDPAKANVADSGKSLDAFGLWVEDIENFEPAEYFEDKELFEDYDGMGKYWNDHILRPISNLITTTRDFNINGVSQEVEAE
jgi:hypothetical protein